MLIVDAQVHVWAADHPDRPWPRPLMAPQRAEPLLPDELLVEMEQAGVDATVLVPPIWEGGRNDIALQAAQARPDRFAVMGRIDQMDPATAKLFPRWLEQPGMLGIRLAFGHADLWPLLSAGHFNWIWTAAEKAGIPLMVLVPHLLVPEIDKVAERHPGLKIVMDHLSVPSGLKDAAAFRDIDQVYAIAKRPNVAAKVSALPSYSTDRYPYPSLHPYIRRAYDAFGPQRCFWGTDISRSPITLRQHVTLFTEALPWLTGQDLEWVMGRGVCQWLGWKLPGAF